MALVFQYGSNMSVARLNGDDRLAGDARTICVAKTVERFELAFSVWSDLSSCAAANLLPSRAGRNIHGVLYEIPEFLLSRDTARQKSRKSLDQIENEGKSYVRAMIDLIANDGARVRAMTYLVKTPRSDLKTSAAYVGHILAGLREHNMPEEYCQYVRSRIIENNGELRDVLPAFTPNE